MNLILVGTAGSIISKSRTYPAFLINDDLLLDCGEGTTQKLLKLDVIDKINTICLTHLHNDHFMGIISLIWYYWISGIAKQLQIIGPQKTEETIKKILKLTHTPEKLGSLKIKYTELEDSEKLQEIQTNYTIKSIKVEHVFPAYAYRIEDNNSVITYTGDTKPNQRIINLAKGSDILLCEATFPDKLQRFAHKHGHCTSSDAARIAKDSNSKKLILVHVSSVFENQIPKIKQQAERIFENDVIIGEDLMKLEI
jgi:ribonuclease Z